MGQFRKLTIEDVKALDLTSEQERDRLLRFARLDNDVLVQLIIARRLGELAKRMEEAVVVKARETHTWEQIGAAWGFSRQAAHQRWGPPPPPKREAVESTDPDPEAAANLEAAANAWLARDARRC